MVEPYWYQGFEGILGIHFGVHFININVEVIIISSESRVQSEILLALSQRGHRLWRANAGTIKDERTGSWVKLFPKGFPDTCGYRYGDGKFIVIEVKNEKGKLSDVQIKFRDFAITQPIIYGVARSAEQAIEIVEEEAKYHD